MAKRKMNAADEFFYWASTAPLNEVEEQYKRMGSVVATRRRASGKRPTTKKIDPAKTMTIAEANLAINRQLSGGAHSVIGQDEVRRGSL